MCVRSLSAWLALGLALLLCACVCFLGLGSAKEMFRTVWRLSVWYGVRRSFLGMLLGKVGGDGKLPVAVCGRVVLTEQLGGCD